MWMCGFAMLDQVKAGGADEAFTVASLQRTAPLKTRF